MCGIPQMSYFVCYLGLRESCLAHYLLIHPRSAYNWTSRKFAARVSYITHLGDKLCLATLHTCPRYATWQGSLVTLPSGKGAEEVEDDGGKDRPFWGAVGSSGDYRGGGGVAQLLKLGKISRGNCPVKLGNHPLPPGNVTLLE